MYLDVNWVSVHASLWVGQFQGLYGANKEEKLVEVTNAKSLEVY